MIVSSTDGKSHDEATFFFCGAIPRDSSTTLGMTEEVNAMEFSGKDIHKEGNAREYSRGILCGKSGIARHASGELCCGITEK